MNDHRPARPFAVRFETVSKRFTLHRDRPRSFQEWAVRWLRPAADEEDFWALRDVNFTVYPGEAVAFVGSNGAGKSSLLKLVNGIIAPTGGAVTVNGRISGLLELGAGFHPDLTGRENVYLNGSILGMSKSSLDELFPAILRFAELDEFIDMPLKHYSSGMQMRLGFSVAIHVQPDILLVDEVLAVGDAAFQTKCMQRILELKKRGVTILLVTHDLDAVRKLCDRAFWLHHSRIAAEGAPNRVIAAYLDQVTRQQAADRVEEQQAEASDMMRWGTREVEITGVEFLDGAGRPTTEFDTGAPFVARIHYHADQPVERPMVGVALHHEDGTHVTGPNTVTAGYDIERLAGNGWVDYMIDDLPLVAGNYMFTAAIYDYWETAAFDHHDKAYTFRVRPGAAERYGVVMIPARWRHASREELGSKTYEESPSAA